MQEVAPRDGLQIEPHWVETSDKIDLVDALTASGLRRIEVRSFVSPKASAVAPRRQLPCSPASSASPAWSMSRWCRT